MIIPGLAGSVGLSPGNMSMYDTLRQLGLTTNLKMALDAGDNNSYSGSGQTWTNLVGSGEDFFRGTTSSSQSSDPTFNGQAGGLSNHEYWSFDGTADIFKLNQSNPSWVNNMHKASQNTSFCSWFYLGAGNIETDHVFFDSAGSYTGSSAIGVTIDYDPTFHNLINYVRNLPDPQTIAIGTVITVHPSAGWNFIGMSYNATNGNSYNYILNDYTVTTSIGTSATGSAAATSVAQIGAMSASGFFWPAGSFLSTLNIWQGTKLTNAEFLSIFRATRNRYGV